MRIRGRDADLVVTEATGATAAPPPPTDGGDVARITLRLPEPLKDVVEHAASAEGISVNAWLVRATSAAVEARPNASTASGRTARNRFSGWVG